MSFLDWFSKPKTPSATPKLVPPFSGMPKSNLPLIDTSKRYDVWCSERDVREVVYRNVLFKGLVRLLSQDHVAFACEFFELEQANGQTVFVGMMTIVRFCEHGHESVVEVVAAKEK